MSTPETGLPGHPDSPLTAAILEDLIADAAHLATTADLLLSPVVGHRDTLRQHLEADGHILALGPADPSERSVVAVDGGSVREHLYVADLLVAVAASAEGMTATRSSPLGRRHWTAVRRYVSDNDRLLSAAMASLELDLIMNLGHDLRILDGAFRTPLVSLSTGLTATSPDTADAVADLITPEILDAAARLADPTGTPGVVVALPKADSAHQFTDTYRQSYQVELPGGDRFLAAQVLSPGEMLYPRVATEYGTLHVPVPEQATARIRDLARALDEAVAPLRIAAQQRRVLVTYLKPQTADTVVKVEYRSDTPLPDVFDAASDAVACGQHLARLLSDETPGPFLQEPYAQYAVDLAAKSVSVGAEALNQAMLANLPAGSSDGYILGLAMSYRTKAGRASAPSRPGTGR